MTADHQTSHHMTLANRVTILRILAVPVFILMLLYYTQGLALGRAEDGYRIAALVVFIVAAATDALDGYLARSRDEITHLGKILDPLADKALLLSALILLTRPALPSLEPHIPVWFTLLVISRDVVLILGAAVIHAVAGSVVVKPRVVGKVATFFQMITITWVLMQGRPRLFAVWILLAGSFTFISGVWYLFDGLRQLEKHSAAPGRMPSPP
ncbi:MAG TPA: CDP-alcohol phosphatidyltransferase family protein [Kiritimatiellia bacterium]|nr:CDP-alcohol phosphatidyltransferase family protein [Kiritimatiellia bacterium]HRZ11400.1 CDP-alcohol phosphatidyltransferase family protein [Kiritimatiellia bacterium]HSA17049.1 CDP-alcohol phosphatidyltransferase family protein [Kiritimatiellia bacterium]